MEIEATIMAENGSKIEELQAEVERLQRELDQSSSEKIQSVTFLNIAYTYLMDTSHFATHRLNMDWYSLRKKNNLKSVVTS